MALTRVAAAWEAARGDAAESEDSDTLMGAAIAAAIRAEADAIATEAMVGLTRLVRAWRWRSCRSPPTGRSRS